MDTAQQYETDQDLYNLIHHQEIMEKKNYKADVNVCYECNSANILDDYEKGSKVCMNCGSIIGDTSSDTPEWRNYEDDADRSNVRCNYITNMLLPQSTLGTNIAGKSKSLVHRLHIWSAIPYKERKLMKEFKNISRVCKMNKIPGYIEDDTKILYKNATDGKYIKREKTDSITILRGDNEKGLIAACLFFACKRKGYIFNAQEISDMFDVSKTKMTSGCKVVKQLLKANKMVYETNNNKPSHYFERLLSKLGMETYMEECIMISNNMYKLNISTQHTPLSIISAIILLVISRNNIDIDSSIICKISNVTKATLSKTFSAIYPYRKILYNTQLVTDIVSEIEKQKDIIYAMPKEYADMYKDLCENYDKYIDPREDEIMYSTPENYTRKITLNLDKKRQERATRGSTSRGRGRGRGRGGK